MGSTTKGKDLKKLTRLELYELAKNLNIKGRSTLSKSEMIEAISKAQAREDSRPPEKPEPVKTAPAPTSLPTPSGSASKAPPKQFPKATSKGKKTEARVQPFLPSTDGTETPVAPVRSATVSEPRTVDQPAMDLPKGYGETSLILQIRDPHWAHAYWEISEKTLAGLRRALGDEGMARGRYVLRVTDVTESTPDGGNVPLSFDTEIFPGANSWYLHLGRPGRKFVAGLGIIAGDGTYVEVVRSSQVETPRDTYSEISEEKWMVVEDRFQQIYQASGGFNVGASSGELRQAMARRFQEELSSGGVSSFGAFSSPGKKEAPPRPKDFWLVVNTELVVYGATEPDARVSVQGRDVQLRPDGTFSLRFALPDGDQAIPVHAVSSDGEMDRTITPIVRKTTC